MILGQCDKETQTKLKQNAAQFNNAVQDGDLLGFLQMLKAICLESDEHGMLYRPIRGMIATRKLFCYENQSNLHEFKENLRTIYHVAKASTCDHPFGIPLL